MQKTITHNGNIIEIKNNSLTGREEVFYNKEIMSTKNSLGGSTHVFRVTENNEQVQYEVDMSLRWHGMSYYTIVRRKGEIIFSDK